MKNFLIKISFLLTFSLLTPFLSDNSVKACVSSTEESDETLYTGTVIGVNLNILGINTFVVLEQNTGIIYTAEPTSLEVGIGSTVTFNKTKKGTKGAIVIRDVIRK